jgi:NADH:ubiquinone oxidoreductase subunit E
MDKKIKIKICLGSSCYRRGNQKILEIVRDYLEENDLSSLVDFRGDLCMGQCAHGPVIVIGDERHVGISPDTVLPILESAISEHTIFKA